jgi:hypothetical protein
MLPFNARMDCAFETLDRGLLNRSTVAALVVVVVLLLLVLLLGSTFVSFRFVGLIVPLL